MTSVIIFILIFRLTNICYNTTFKCDRLDLFCNWPHLVLFTKSYYYCGIVTQMYVELNGMQTIKTYLKAVWPLHTLLLMNIYKHFRSNLFDS